MRLLVHLKIRCDWNFENFRKVGGLNTTKSGNCCARQRGAGRPEETLATATRRLCAVLDVCTWLPPANQMVGGARRGRESTRRENDSEFGSWRGTRSRLERARETRHRRSNQGARGEDTPRRTRRSELTESGGGVELVASRGCVGRRPETTARRKHQKRRSCLPVTCHRGKKVGGKSPSPPQLA